NQNHVEIWGADAGSTTMKMLAVADNANITMTRGVIWLEDVHYNACKFDNQCDHELAWDNVGFDGPTPYRDLTFDVPDAGVPVAEGLQLGYHIGPAPTTLAVQGVYQLQPAKTALIGFNWYPYVTEVPSVSVNGNPPVSVAWPFDPTAFGWRT